MRGCIEAIPGREQNSMLGGGLTESTVVLSAQEPGECGHAALRRNPAEYITMVRHEAVEELQVSASGFLRLAEHNVSFSDCDFRQDLSRRGVRDREVSARVPVLSSALFVVLDHPSCAHSGN